MFKTKQELREVNISFLLRSVSTGTSTRIQVSFYGILYLDPRSLHLPFIHPSIHPSTQWIITKGPFHAKHVGTDRVVNKTRPASCPQLLSLKWGLSSPWTERSRVWSGSLDMKLPEGGSVSLPTLPASFCPQQTGFRSFWESSTF